MSKVKELYEEYLKLDIREKTRFKNRIKKDDVVQEDKMKRQKEKLLEEMMRIKKKDMTSDGDEPFFNEEYLRKHLGLEK